jgi:vanillate O-demethylase monooxygenase subunit
VVDGTVECPYHGYRFDSGGRCVEIPALGLGAPVPPKAHITPAWGCEIHYGLIWVSPEEALTPIPIVPELDDPDFDAVMLPTLEWSATAAQMADNFLDVGHFPFVHLGTIGNPDDRLVDGMTVERDGWTFTASHSHLSNALQGGTTTAEAEGRDLVYIATAPHHVYLRITYLTSGLTLSMTFFHQAVDETTTRVFGMYLRNDLRDGSVSVEETTAFQLAVGAEDKVLLESLDLKAVAVDPTYEVHTRADRNTLELRRMLRDLSIAALPATPISLSARVDQIRSSNLQESPA